MKKKHSEIVNLENYKAPWFTYKRQRVFWGIVFISPWIIGFLLFFLQPLVKSLMYSFQEVKPSATGLETTWVGFDKYVQALTEHPTFVRVLTETTWDTLINLPVLLIFSLLIAVLLNTEFKGRAIARALFFIPVIFNSAAISSALGSGEALRNILESSGVSVLAQGFDLEMFLVRANMNVVLVSFIAGTISRIYTIISVSGIQILIFLAGIQSVPKHLYEAARIEGATTYELFWKITLPMVSPLILTAAVYTVIDSFLRSPVNSVINETYTTLDYGLNASMSWLYFIATAILLIVSLSIINKGVFYYDE